MRKAESDTAEWRERERRRLFVLNRLPLNESARRIIERDFPDPPITEGLYLIRLVACVAREQGVDFDGNGEEVAWDIRALSEMCADDAADFMAYYLREDDGEDADNLLTGDAKTDVMREIYSALPPHIREAMMGMAECDAVEDRYLSDTGGGWNDPPANFQCNKHCTFNADRYFPVTKA